VTLLAALTGRERGHRENPAVAGSVTGITSAASGSVA
jgi:hypothetical protein